MSGGQGWETLLRARVIAPVLLIWIVFAGGEHAGLGMIGLSGSNPEIVLVLARCCTAFLRLRVGPAPSGPI